MPSRLVRLVATARMMYAGRSLHAGREFECSPEDAADLLAMKLARHAEAQPKGTYRRRDMQADEP